MATVLCVLYADPVAGYPPEYPRDEIPKIERYHGGQTTPTPEGLDFTPGELLGCQSRTGEVGDAALGAGEARDALAVHRLPDLLPDLVLGTHEPETYRRPMAARMAPASPRTH